MTRLRTCEICGVLCIVALKGAAFASGPIEAAWNVPTLDRWMYPFNETPGTRPLAPIFAALDIAGFDDRDAQLLIGFNTSGQITPGQGADSYRIARARIRAIIAMDRTFEYDPTHDPLNSYFAPGEPGYIPDEDPGRPIELFAAGYRNGFSATTFMEHSPFGGAPIVPPAEGSRHVFAANLDAQAHATDISRNVRLRVEAVPLAIGQTSAVAPGELVPADTEFEFEIDLCVLGAQTYLARALDEGMLHLVITSLHAIPGPGGPVEYPVFYTKENALAMPPFSRAAKLELTVVIDCDPDLDANGVLDVFDFLTFGNLFAAGDLLADFDGDCVLDIFDFLAFGNAFSLGGC